MSGPAGALPTAPGPGHSYQVLARREQFHNRIFRVLTDEVVMPDGDTATRDYLVHVGAVGVVALDTMDRVALVRQYRHAVGRPLWELPAGLVDVPGEPLVEAAARELSEEADLRAGRWDLLVDVHTTPGCSNEIIRIFLARDLAPVPGGQRHRRVAEESELEVRWVVLDEAVAAALDGTVTNAACQVGLMAAACARAQAWRSLRPVDVPLPRTLPAGPAA